MQRKWKEGGRDWPGKWLWRELVSQKGLVDGWRKEVKRRLEDQATNDATVRTRRSLGNSCFDGSKFGGGSLSIIDDFNLTSLELFPLRRFILGIRWPMVHFFVNALGDHSRNGLIWFSSLSVMINLFYN